MRGLYLADEAETAVAEWYRVLAELGLPPARSVPHDHHLWRLGLELADLSDEARLAAVGLGAPRPTRRSWPPFRDVGEALWRAGWRGVLAPSAARPRAQIVCVFDDGAWPPPGCHPEQRIEISSVPTPPTGMTT